MKLHHFVAMCQIFLAKPLQNRDMMKNTFSLVAFELGKFMILERVC